MRPLRLLVVDDQDGFRELLAMMLATSPLLEVVGAAENGAQAVALAGELEPDVVLMDIAMPVMSGFEGTRRIRVANPEVRVLMLTGSAADADLKLARAAGASGYVTKSMLDGLVDAILNVAPRR